ncbi:hypothetical protein LEP1GSC041_1768 [Leptospira noguchii str. 2006001870]|nr:hypothetical protein LEP1GSC041_1768 [Leptospira noguchii str. 2006001870]
MIHSSEKSWDLNFTNRFPKMWDYHNLKKQKFIKIESVVFQSRNSHKTFMFVCKMMWELLQITILRTNSQIVGAYTFRKFFLSRTKSNRFFIFAKFTKLRFYIKI